MVDVRTLRVLIADDNRVIRAALRGIMRHDEGLTVVGEASTGEEALEMIETLEADIVCLDVSMPGRGGMSALATIREKYAAIGVVIITGHGNSVVQTDAVQLGADGFVLKPFHADQVLHAIYQAAQRVRPDASSSSA
jgi:DNA-binding NarL/FixJ family response regulator